MHRRERALWILGVHNKLNSCRLLSRNSGSSWIVAISAESFWGFKAWNRGDFPCTVEFLRTSSPKKHCLASTQANFPISAMLAYSGYFFNTVWGSFSVDESPVSSGRISNRDLLKGGSSPASEKLTVATVGDSFWQERLDSCGSPLASSICDCDCYTITHSSEDCCLDRAYWCVGSGIYGHPGFPGRSMAGSVGVGLFIVASDDWYDSVSSKMEESSSMPYMKQDSVVDCIIVGCWVVSTGALVWIVIGVWGWGVEVGKLTDVELCVDVHISKDELVGDWKLS